MDKRVKTAGRLLISFLGTWAVGWMFHERENTLGYTNSIFSFFVFLGLFYLIGCVKKHSFAAEKRKWIWPGIVGTVFAGCMVFGAQLDYQENVPLTSLPMWGAILVLAFLCTILVRFFWDLLFEKIEERVDPLAETGAKSSLKSWAITAGILFLCYLPVFLAVYPGFFTYDALDELGQVVTRDFSTHHPLVHVLLLGGIVQAGYKLTGDYNVGIAVYTLLQMAIMAGIFAWCVEMLKKRGLPKFWRVLFTLYLGLCPVLVMYALCSAKDGLFMGMLLIMLLLMQEMCRETENFFRKKGYVALLILASAGMMLLRHNGFYAFLVFLPFLIFGLKKWWKQVALYAAVALVLYGGVSAGLAGILHADASENQEMLTVPIMQLARVYNYEPDSLTEEELEKLYSYLPQTALEKYNPKLADLVKIAFDNEAFAEDKAGFFKLWLGVGLKQPATYVNAWLMTSYGFWYPDTVIDVYRGNQTFTFTYGDSSYFGYEVEEPGVRESKIPWLNELYRKMSLEIFQQKVPVVSMLFSPGFLFWIFAFLLGGLCYRGYYRRVIPYVLSLLCVMTYLIGPTYLVRYVVFLWVVVPVLIYNTVQE